MQDKDREAIRLAAISHLNDRRGSRGVDFPAGTHDRHRVVFWHVDLGLLDVDHPLLATRDTD